MRRRWKPGPILLQFVGAAREVGFRFPRVVRPVIASPVHIEASTAPATSIAPILTLHYPLNLKLHLTVVSELRWRRDKPPTLNIRFEETDVEHVMDPRVGSQIKLIGGVSYPFNHLKGANKFWHKLGRSNSLEGDVGSAQEHTSPLLNSSGLLPLSA